MGPHDRAIAQLERELDDAETAEDRAAIVRELRDIERDAYEQEQWQREGEERGWW